jgi:serine/threonine protein kinase/outer membrane protein assembly factor BamB
MNTPPAEPRKTPPAFSVGDETATHDGVDCDLGFLQTATRPDSLGRLGHYEVLEILGHGGFGIVFRAFDEVLQRVVAIKVLAPRLAATSPARKRFLREARAAAQVRHKNVVQTYSVEEQPLPFLVMEFIRGETLQAKLDRTGPFGAMEVAVIGRQVADGLAAAHAVGLIHRDVKPGNILIDAGAKIRVKITDFGLARTTDDATITQSGAVVGTPLYMSPEQAASDPLDHRCDLFSLGSVLYAITTGRPPFRAPNTLAILKRVAEDTPRPIQEIIPETPAGLCRIIERLMAKAPSERFQSAVEVGAALEVGDTIALPRRKRRPARSRRLAWFAIAAVLLVGLAALALWASGLLGPTSGSESAQRPSESHPSQKTADPLPAGPSLRPLPGGFEVTGAELNFPAVSEDGKLLAAPSGGRVCLFETPSGRRIRTVTGAGGRVRTTAVSSTGHLLAAVSGIPEPLRLRVWDLDTFQELYTQESQPNSALAWPVFSLDGAKLVYCPEAPGDYVVLNARTGMEIKSLPGGKHGFAQFSPNGTLLATCDDDAVSLWNTNTWERLAKGEPPPGECRCLRFRPDGAQLAVGTSERLDQWSVPAFDRVGGFDIKCHYWLAFSPDGQTILAAATHHALKTHIVTQWDVKTGTKKSQIDIRSAGKFYFYPTLGVEGRVLYVADENAHKIRAFDPENGEELLPLAEDKAAN